MNSWYDREWLIETRMLPDEWIAIGRAKSLGGGLRFAKKHLERNRVFVQANLWYRVSHIKDGMAWVSRAPHGWRMKWERDHDGVW